MKKNSSIVFTGDIGFDKYMDQRWLDEELISPGILDFLHRGDHVVINVEGALVNPVSSEKSGIQQLVHSMNPKAILVFKKMKADVWNLCNNHIMDAGQEGLEETLSLAKKHQVKTIGAGRNLEEAKKPVYFEEAGGIGLFSVGYRRGCKPATDELGGCYLWNEMDAIQKTIDEIKRENRWCVLVVHGGEEFTSLPSPYTRDRYLAYLEMGVDVIVAHHPHVPMNYETIGDKVIFYSLGNFIFDTDYQRAQFNTEFGEVIKLNFTENQFTWEAMGIKINRELERIEKAPLAPIFVDIQEGEYKLLLPLAAKMMVSAYKRQLIYLKPEEFSKATEEQWEENFLAEKRSGRVEKEGLDFQIMYPLSLEAAKGDWKKSSLEKVKEYILRQL